jgi:uncharacterized protein (DUF849 family)
MVAPNGARRTKADHSALPITQRQIVDAVADAHAAGAQAAHVHVRDDDGAHVLDADRYLRLTEALCSRCGDDLVIQVTTEAVGRYTPQQQRQLVRDVKPQAVSIAFRELFSEAKEQDINVDFLNWAQSETIAIQWILYAPDEVADLAKLIDRKIIPTASPLLFVLGRYTKGQQSQPVDIIPFLAIREQHSALQNIPWSVCAFGAAESACLATAFALGGDARIGFENSLWHADGTLARSNADRVKALKTIADELGLQHATSQHARERLMIGQL